MTDGNDETMTNTATIELNDGLVYDVHEPESGQHDQDCQQQQTRKPCTLLDILDDPWGFDRRSLFEAYPDKTFIAIHEAGHAVACTALGGHIAAITVDADDSARGRVYYNNKAKEPEDFEKRMIVSLAGGRAAEMFFPMRRSNGGSQDFDIAFNDARWLNGKRAGDVPCHDDMLKARERACRLTLAYRDEILQVAEWVLRFHYYNLSIKQTTLNELDHIA